MRQQVDLYLHIGFGKTGTTAIQDFFYKNRIILSENGVLYPKSGLRGTGHHNLAILGPEGVSDKVKENLVLLEKEIEKSGLNKVFLSSEFFPWLRHDYVECLRKAFSRYNTTVIIYVRNQVELIRSAFLQWQKVGDNYRGSIEAFFDATANSFNYMTRISPYLSAFGENAILARVYDRRIVGNDVRNDILKIIGVDAALNLPEELSNISLLPEFSSLVSLLDNANLSDEMRKSAIDMLLCLSSKFKPLSTKQLVEDSLKSKISLKYRDSNEEFAGLFLDGTQAKVFLEKVYDA